MEPRPRVWAACWPCQQEVLGRLCRAELLNFRGSWRPWLWRSEDVQGGMAKGENQDSVRHLTVINNSSGSHWRIFRSETPYMISDEPCTREQLLLVALTPIGNQKASWERMGQTYRGLKAVELGPSPPPTPSISNPGQVGVQAARSACMHVLAFGERLPSNTSDRDGQVS